MMRAYRKVFTLIAAALLLASCSQTPVASVPAGPTRLTVSTAPVQTAAALSSAPAGSAAATALPLPLPTYSIIPDMPDPSNWASSLHIDAKDYPRVDGSTANIPLGVYMRSKITGASLSDSTAATQFTTTGPSYLALDKGEADLLIVYEAPREIKDKIADMNNEFLIKPIGLDALVFLVNSGNPVNSLSHQQLVGIYTGKINNWSQVGGQDSEIIPYQRVSDSGSQALMLKLVMKNNTIMDAPVNLSTGEMGDLVRNIASYGNTNNALGYSVYYYVHNMYKVPGIKLLSINGVEPNSNTIASGAYPYINPFYAVIRSDEPAGSNTRKLFNWLTGAEGKRAVADAGYVAAQQ